MSGYAVKKDGTGWRTVDGPTADPDNPSKIFPDDKFEYYSESLPEPPAPSAEQLVSMAVAQRDSLLSFAALRIAPLQDAVDLDLATDVEVARLKSWKKYRVAVNRVDVSLNPPPWPELPED